MINKIISIPNKPYNGSTLNLKGMENTIITAGNDKNIRLWAI